ncbi:fungal-specific transcription factor domain-containing protein [Coniochaeta sp. 2T2.1]|nr:fungal-specific transcription factor domain-containing protein [Coniochaeta sp. 2T2.1]
MATSAIPALQPNGLSRPTFACIRCAERKVKCDRQRPCSACVNHKVDCVFQPPRPPRKRHNHAREQILSDRLKYYEALLQQQGIDPGNSAKSPEHSNADPRHVSSLPVAAHQHSSPQETPSSPRSSATGAVSRTRIIQSGGRSLFVANSLWSRVAEELHCSQDPHESRSEEESVTDELSDDECKLVLCGPPRVTARLRHPSAERIVLLWKVFAENIDPLTKLLHVPTMSPVIVRASNTTDTIPRELETLMFAMYSISVSSLDDEECKQHLGDPRAVLLARFIAATKLALARARFMSTTSLLVLQALVLHLLSIRDLREPRAIWSLTGVAMRIAQSLGLDRDGSMLGVSPFDSEMRRRIWWLLTTHDHHIAELCGLSKFRQTDVPHGATKWPSNVNDDQLHPGMTTSPTEPDALTDAAFVALRYELASFATSRVAKFRQLGKCYDDWERYLASQGGSMESDTAVMEMKAHLETKYLRYCDPSQPLHLMTMLLARSAINTIKFLTHHPRRWPSISQAPSEERHLVWEVCINLLEQHNMLHSSPQLKRFAWQASSVMQWHAFIHILDTLQAEPLIQGADKAWRLVGSTYTSNQAMINDTRKPIHVAVASLCLKAYDARLTAVSPERDASRLPKFILQLREQRDFAQTMKQSRKAGKSPYHSVGPVGETTSRLPDSDAGVTHLGIAGSTDDNTSRVPRPPNAVHKGDDADVADTLWGFNEHDLDLDLDPAGIGNASMGLATDLPAIQAEDGDWNGDATISWEQWDNWLAESNAMNPFPI